MHSPKTDKAPEGESFAGAADLEGMTPDGVTWVGVAVVVASFDDVDEHPASNASPLPPQATKSAALLTDV